MTNQKDQPWLTVRSMTRWMLDTKPKPVTINPVMRNLINKWFRNEVKTATGAMFRYFYAPVIGFTLVLAIVCGFVIGFDEVWRYWRVAALNL